METATRRRARARPGRARNRRSADVLVAASSAPRARRTRRASARRRSDPPQAPGPARARPVAQLPAHERRAGRRAEAAPAAKSETARGAPARPPAKTRRADRQAAGMRARPGRGRPRSPPGAPVVERVSRRRVGLDPLDVELESPKKRRCQRERMDGRADVVDEARERQLGRAQATAELLVGLVNLDLQAGPRERDRSREPVRP